jgi:hypothetical protein
MKNRFTIEPHSTIQKSFRIEDFQDEIVLYVDFDDVNHKRVDKIIKALVKLMNKNQKDLG